MGPEDSIDAGLRQRCSINVSQRKLLTEIRTPVVLDHVTNSSRSFIKIYSHSRCHLVSSLLMRLCRKLINKSVVDPLSLSACQHWKNKLLWQRMQNFAPDCSNVICEDKFVSFLGLGTSPLQGSLNPQLYATNATESPRAVPLQPPGCASPPPPAAPSVLLPAIP